MGGVIHAVASAAPKTYGQDEMWDRFFGAHFNEDERAKAVWDACGITARHSVIREEEAAEIPAWGTQRRMERFVEEALPLAADSLQQALLGAGVAPEQVDLLAVVSCTGYVTPGLDILLSERLGMRPDLQRLHIGHMGCYAALPGLAAVSDAAAGRGLTAALVCVELPTLHLRPWDGTIEQVIAHALFSDAASAAVVVPRGPGLEVVDVRSVTDVSTAPMMRWDITDHGFRMRLSPAVPSVLDRHVGDAMASLLGAHGLTPADIEGWAVHPGGPRILEGIAEQLGLEDGDLDASRRMLAQHGNCSSPTVLLVLEELLAEAPYPLDANVVAMSFGPGLTLYSALLRSVV